MNKRCDSDRTRHETARALAEQIALVFRYHDENDREAAVEAMRTVDEAQFAHLDADEVDETSEAYVDALWEKDALEASYLPDDGLELDREGLREADWSPVREAFERRADVAGIDPRYATATTRAWRNHKVGGDYWTPFQEAQVYELRAALQDEAYPYKPRCGQSGFGPEAARYAVAVELHDMHSEVHWNQTVDVMTPYFERILRGHLE